MENQAASSSMDAACVRLQQYDFASNIKFMQGWRKVRPAIPDDKVSESLMKAQVYFYSREVEPIDVVTYRHWLITNQRKIKDIDIEASLANLNKEREGNKGDKCENMTKDNKATAPATSGDAKSEKHPDKANDQEPLENADSNEINYGKHPESFMELVEMIQNGVKLPGTEGEDIQALNIDPTPCEKQRPKKPWEVT